MESAQEHIARLLAQIAALETELANYAAKYGLSDAARDLLRRQVK